MSDPFVSRRSIDYGNGVSFTLHHGEEGAGQARYHFDLIAGEASALAVPKWLIDHLNGAGKGRVTSDGTTWTPLVKPE